MLEGHLRRRLLTLPGIVPLLGHRAESLLAVGGGRDGTRAGGVVVSRRGARREVRADLVVDATGRGSRAPAWMEALGYARPVEETITIGVGYTTRRYRRRPADLDGDGLVLTHAQPPHGLRAGFAFPVEGDAWIVTLTGWLNDHAPADEAGFRAYARSLAAPDIADLIERAEPLDDGAVYKFPSSVRRRFERLERLPDGYLTIGDALCSFNPVYGQGMTAAAMEADALDAALRAAAAGGGASRRATTAGWPRWWTSPWSLAAGADFAFPRTTGPKAPGTDAINWYVGHLRRAMADDADGHPGLRRGGQSAPTPGGPVRPADPAARPARRPGRRRDGRRAGAPRRGTRPGAAPTAPPAGARWRSPAPDAAAPGRVGPAGARVPVRRVQRSACAPHPGRLGLGPWRGHGQAPHTPYPPGARPHPPRPPRERLPTSPPAAQAYLGWDLPGREADDVGRIVLKGSRRRAGSGRLPGGREDLGERLGERLGMGQGAACPAPGISCTRALGTWSTTYRALAVKKGLVSAPSSTTTGAEIAPSTAGCRRWGLLTPSLAGGG